MSRGIRAIRGKLVGVLCRLAANELEQTTGDYMPSSMLRRIMTDAHFWIPAVVLIIGIAVLILIH
jgi:hypothetical protein